MYPETGIGVWGGLSCCVELEALEMWPVAMLEVYEVRACDLRQDMIRTRALRFIRD